MTKANDSFKHCTGTDNYFKDLMLVGYYTDVVRELANYCEAYWLIDLIFSHQNNEKVKEEQFQVWELKRQSDNVFNIICTDGNENKVTSQQIPFSDFKFDLAVLWLIDGVLILPSEY